MIPKRAVASRQSQPLSQTDMTPIGQKEAPCESTRAACLRRLDALPRPLRRQRECQGQPRMTDRLGQWAYPR